MVWLLAQLLIAYGLGAVSGSLVLGRLKGVDIRSQGSGNAGGSNALRVLGWRFALGVVLIDMLKGALAAGLIPLLGDSVPSAALWCGLAAVVGHIWPAWHGFRGGKGGATAAGVLVVVLPLAVIPVVVVWLLALTVSGYAGLATLLAALTVIPAAVWLAPAESWWDFCLFAVLLAALVGFAHRGNLQRMRKGEEARFEKARLFTGRRNENDSP